MLHNETRNLLIQAYNKTHNAKEVAAVSYTHLTLPTKA